MMLVNLKDTPILFRQFIHSYAEEYQIDLYFLNVLNSEKAQWILREKFGFKSAWVCPSNAVGMVELDEKDYIWYRLKWT